jgi:hypothetical protein
MYHCLASGENNPSTVRGRIFLAKPQCPIHLASQTGWKIRCSSVGSVDNETCLQDLCGLPSARE